MTFWAYMLHCRGGLFYAGHTDDLERRVAQHKSGSIAGFTSGYLPVELVWSQEFDSRDEALAAERQIKGWSRRKKLTLIRGDWDAIGRHAKCNCSPSTGSGRTEIVIPRSIHERMLAEAVAAHPRECCGMLLGEGHLVHTARPAANVHPQPETHFEIDPQALIDAHRAARQGGPQVLGYYHSHPNGLAEPSTTDRAMAHGVGEIWAIVASGAVSLWRDGDDGFAALPYRIVGG